MARVLLLVQGELLGAEPEVLLLAGAEVGSEAPKRLGGHVARRADVGRRIEHHAAARGRHEAALRRRDGVHHRALRGIAQELFREL